MIRLLPFIVIPILLVVGGLYYLNIQPEQKKEDMPESGEEVIKDPQEVPKTLPEASLEKRVEALEKVVGSNSKSASPIPKSQSDNSLDSRVDELESEITGLKVRVSGLEQATPAPVSSSKSVVYIPLGSGGGPWGNTDWYSTAEYEISLDPSNYPGYTGMSLEVTLRLVEAAGVGSVRLYNVTDGSSVSGQLDTQASTFSLKTSPLFTLTSGTKTYKLQLKSTQGKDLYIQSARIKVNF